MTDYLGTVAIDELKWSLHFETPHRNYNNDTDVVMMFGIIRFCQRNDDEILELLEHTQMIESIEQHSHSCAEKLPDAHACSTFCS